MHALSLKLDNVYICIKGNQHNKQIVPDWSMIIFDFELAWLNLWKPIIYTQKTHKNQYLQVIHLAWIINSDKLLYKSTMNTKK